MGYFHWMLVHKTKNTILSVLFFKDALTSQEHGDAGSLYCFIAHLFQQVELKMSTYIKVNIYLLMLM